MDPIEQFRQEREQDISRMSEDQRVQSLSFDWLANVAKYKYSYNFKWLDRPIIQMPTDIMALQEIIWRIKPDLIIETGIAHGGSIIFSASMLEIIGGDGKVIGIDIDIRQHNRREIENHPLIKRIIMLEGSSTDSGIISKVREISKTRKKIMVLLDSSHTHQHVLEELQIYSEFVTKGSYLVVFDTIVEFMPHELFVDRPWGVGNNPWTATQQFLQTDDRFVVDKSIQEKILVTAAVDGYLQRIK